MIETLRRLPGFDRLPEGALEIIIARSAMRRYEPDQIVLAAGSVAEALLVCIEGEVLGEDGTSPMPVFDTPGLLFGLAAAQHYRAGPTGMTALVVAKPHLFTIVREFPEFVVSLLRHGEGA